MRLSATRRGTISTGRGLGDRLYDLAGALPSLDLQFANQKVLDSRVTFTRASSGTYVGSDGVIRTAAVDAPRFDHNPTTGESLGLLVEEQRTNLFVRSQEIDNASWLKIRSTATDNNTAAPDGTQTAEKVIASIDINTTHFVRQDVAVTSGTAYTQTIYAKAAEYNQLYMSFDADNSAFAGGSVIFTLTGLGSAGVASGTLLSLSIQPLPNGWYRCQISATATATATAVIRIYLVAGGTTGFTGNGTSGIYLWGAQLETGSFPTSYIPSTTTFTSRASTATYFNASGVLQTAAVNEARSNAYLPDSNGVFRPAGLLLEEQRTNSVVNSNSITAVVTGSPGTLPTGWFAQGNSNGWTREVVGSGSIGAINYVDIRFSGTPTGGQFSVNFQSPGVVAASNGQSWSASIYHQLVNGSISGITGFPAANLWNSTLSYIGGLNLSGSIVSTSTLQRFASSSAINSAATAFISWGITFNCTIGNTYDFTIRFAGPQLEQGSSPTSFIPTTTAATTRSADVSTSAATTRSADVPQITGSNFSSWYRQDAVSVFSQFTKSSATTGAPSSINDGTSSNRISGLIVPGSNFSAARNTAGAGTLFTPFTANLPLVGLNKTAQASTNLDHAVVLNGGAVATAATYGMPVVDRLDIGCQLNGSFMNGSLARLTIWPTRLSNSTLQALTQ